MHLIFDVRGHYLNWDSMNTIKMNCFPEVRHLTSWAKERFFYLFSYMHEENKKKTNFPEFLRCLVSSPDLLRIVLPCKEHGWHLIPHGWNLIPIQGSIFI